MKSSTLIWVSQIVLAVSAVTAAQNASLIVPTQSGRVQGVIEGDVRAFRGIPFAAPPVGDLRWQPPAPPLSWIGIRDASTFGNMCPQLDFSSNLVVGDEDCLVLNVYTAANLAPNAGQPVMVFFHGGGDVAGSTQNNPYGAGSATPLAAHGVVVVTAEYRLGALGFFVHPQLAIEGNGSAGNYGLMDHIAALAWVQRNIRNFGGDPARVMFFGQSAGAANVQVLLVSPASRGLFSRAGMESFAIAPHEAKSLESAEAGEAPLVALVGCGSAADVLACLRAVPASVLIANQFAVPMGFVLEPRVIPRDPLTVLQQNGSPVPLLIGSTREEATGTSFVSFDPSLTAAHYVAMVQADFGFLGSNVVDGVLASYPVSAYDHPFWALVAAVSDFSLTCEVRNTARAAIGPPNEPQYAPVWRYLFTHRVENNHKLNALRAFHTEELYFLFGHVDQLKAAIGVPELYVPSADELQLSNLVMDYWTRFAAKGDPNGPGEFHWPRYSADDLLLQLDVTPARLAGYHNPQCDFFTPILNTICLKFPGHC